jgi:hypothetical protein
VGWKGLGQMISAILQVSACLLICVAILGLFGRIKDVEKKVAPLEVHPVILTHVSDQAVCMPLDEYHEDVKLKLVFVNGMIQLEKQDYWAMVYGVPARDIQWNPDWNKDHIYFFFPAAVLGVEDQVVIV